MKFGWTVIKDPKGSGFLVYKRDCPADGPAAGLAKHTYKTKKLAEKSGRAGNYAYK